MPSTSQKITCIRRRMRSIVSISLRCFVLCFFVAFTLCESLSFLFSVFSIEHLHVAKQSCSVKWSHLSDNYWMITIEWSRLSDHNWVIIIEWSHLSDRIGWSHLSDRNWVITVVIRIEGSEWSWIEWTQSNDHTGVIRRVITSWMIVFFNNDHNYSEFHLLNLIIRWGVRT